MTDNRESAAPADAIAIEEENAAELLVVTFAGEDAARDAVRVLNKALRERGHTIYQGAMISRAADSELRIRDLRDMGLGDLITGTAGLAIDVGRTGLKLTWAAVSTGAAVVIGGVRLAGNTIERALGLLGTFASVPVRRRLARFDPDTQVQDRAQALAEGETAIVLLAAHETAADLATALARSGGKIG